MPLTNTQYDTIMRRYEARQTENRHRAEQRRQEVYAHCPQLARLEEEIASLAVAKARMLLDSDGEISGDWRRELHSLIHRKESMLSQAGYPRDYLEPPCLCPDCKDTGFIGREKCHCFKQAAIDLVYTQSNLRDILKEENFDTFSFDWYSPDNIDPSTGKSCRETAQEAVASCHRFISEFDQRFSNLFFYGNTGVGKTFLSNCVAKELLDSGHSVIYFTASKLFSIFEQNTFQKGNGPLSDYQSIFECDLLIIDDLGTEFASSFTSSQLFLCLNERILRRKSTIISTNLNIPQLAEQYSERTFSRITSYYSIIRLSGGDIRVLKKLKGN